MSEMDETQAIGQVIDRLSARFPSLERQHIADVVQDEHGQLNEGRVRDFVPVLVEKAAKRRLKKEAKESRTVVDPEEALAPLPDGVTQTRTRWKSSAQAARARVATCSVVLSAAPERVDAEEFQLGFAAVARDGMTASSDLNTGKAVFTDRSDPQTVRNIGSHLLGGGMRETRRGVGALGRRASGPGIARRMMRDRAP